MNKQQLYTFGGALLASTALSGAAHALTWGKLNGESLNGAFSTSAFSIANTVFSTTAATANGITITPQKHNVAARFSNVYSAATAAGTKFSVEITPSGAAFTTGTAALGNVKFLTMNGTSNSFIDTISAATVCNSVIGFGTQFVLDGCTAATGTIGGTANHSLAIGGLIFSGVTFTNASGLATVGSSVSLTGRIYNTTTSGNFEVASTGNVITSAAPFVATVTAAGNVVVSAATTPTAFTALSSSNLGTATLTMDLVSVNVTATGATTNSLSAYARGATELSSATISVTSSLLSSASVANAHIVKGSGTSIIGTVANFSGGTVTFQVAATDVEGSFTVRLAFNGTSAIPQVSAGTASVTFGAIDTNHQPPSSVSGTTSASSQGGFRAEVNMFNASPNGPYSSYLRIHNNGAVAGAVTITVRNDAHDSGAILGSSFTTATIQPGGTMQLGAAEMEGSTTSTKLPSGGANIPSASRTGNYTVQVTGPIVGYVQHILFDGANVADLSSFRNGGATTAGATP